MLLLWPLLIMPVFAVIQALFKSADRRGSSLKPRTLAVLRELRVRLNQGYVSIGSSRRAAEQLSSRKDRAWLSQNTKW